jgi:small-conductance mechanosensitive channel
MPANQSIRTEIAGIIAVIAFAAAAGFIVSTLISKNTIPSQYAQPIYAIIVLVSGYIWVRIVTAVIEKIVEPTIGVTKAHGIKNVFYIIAGILLVLIVSAIYRYDLTGVLVGAGFAGIVLGLAAQQVLGNIFGGLSLIASRPFEIGDRITLATWQYGLMAETYPHEAMMNGFTGVVTDITIFFTKMDLDNGTPAVFPNSVVVGAMAVNHSRISSRTVRVRMDLDKRVDYETFKEKFLESLKKYDNIIAEKSKVETVDTTISTYQVVMIVWTHSSIEEPIKTMIIQNAIKIQEELTPLPKT